jgi:hypothetical protein
MAARIIRYFWAAPCTAVGIFLGALAVLFGGSARVVEGVIEFSLSRRDRPAFFHKLLPFNAITFGHVVIATHEAEHARLRSHEREHVRQYEKWGVLFFIAYPAASLWEVLRGRRPYVDNWFEIQARARASDDDRQAGAS